MKKKELKSLAQKIARYEKIVQTTDDLKEKARAEQEIMKLSSCVSSLEDITAIDELVMDILSRD